MEYDRGDNFPIDFEPNGILFGPKSERKTITTIGYHEIEKKQKALPVSVLGVSEAFFAGEHSGTETTRLGNALASW